MAESIFADSGYAIYDDDGFDGSMVLPPGRLIIIHEVFHRVVIVDGEHVIHATALALADFPIHCLCVIPDGVDPRRVSFQHDGGIGLIDDSANW